MALTSHYNVFLVIAILLIIISDRCSDHELTKSDRFRFSLQLI